MFLIFSKISFVWLYLSRIIKVVPSLSFLSLDLTLPDFYSSHISFFCWISIFTKMSSSEAIADEDENPKHSQQEEISHQQKLRRYDSLDLESSKVRGHQSRGIEGANWSLILNLAFQSLGVVYGDMGTSPLYVYPATFPNGIKHNDDVLGALSLIFYTITLIPLVKYVFIVLRANDNGDGKNY